MKNKRNKLSLSTLMESEVKSLIMNQRESKTDLTTLKKERKSDKKLLLKEKRSKVFKMPNLMNLVN